jgi:hypothetical protein
MKQNSIMREFPSQFCKTKLADLKKLAEAGDAAARKALKLLTDSRFKK